ncbi:MAG TPA: biopolymer transporter Tol [Pirellulales bacterium]|nr:biopolymer transporter Tol [Pirellulales bacterium]
MKINSKLFLAAVLADVLLGPMFALAADSTTTPTAAATAPEQNPPSPESKYLKNIRQLTTSADFSKAGEGYFSPDGKTIIFQGVPLAYMFYQIYTLPLADENLVHKAATGGRAAAETDSNSPKPKMVSSGRGRNTCSFFAPDGKSIIFASSHLDPNLSDTEAAQRKQDEDDAQAGRHRRYQWDFDPWMEIFSADLDGHLLRRLTDSPGYDAECAYTPDGKHIVFCSNRGGNPNIYVMDADGANVRQLTNFPGYNGGPFTSPDGRWVVYRSDRKKENYLQLHVIGFDGQNDTALTDNIGVNWAPYWHPTLPYIIWTGADHSDPHATPNYDLWLMKYSEHDGHIVPGKIWRITDHPAADVLPVFSPDGAKLMWTSNRTADHTSQLFIADFTLPGESD